MQQYNGVLCISGSELIRSEENPTGLMCGNTYRSLVTRKRINVIRRAGGEGRTALIEFKSLPVKYREAIQSRYGDVPAEAVKQDLLHRISLDQAAAVFFPLTGSSTGIT